MTGKGLPDILFVTKNLRIAREIEGKKLTGGTQNPIEASMLINQLYIISTDPHGRNQIFDSEGENDQSDRLMFMEGGSEILPSNGLRYRQGLDQTRYIDEVPCRQIKYIRVTKG